MGFLNKVLGKVFGNKFDKDVKEITPLVDKTNEIFETLAKLSNDELRARTDKFKGIIQEGLSDIDGQINTIKKAIESQPDLDPDIKEEEYKKIDDLSKERDEIMEEVLMGILPDAFATVKETARRFKENTSLKATASDLDKDLAVNHEHITIEGDQVVFQNQWMAAGNLIVWDMLHYDVQLIGGVVLHQGKIAEMATGEGKTLVSTLPSYLNGLTGEGVHLITVNDYLARRDCEWMSGIFNFLGLTVDCIDRYQPHSEGRYNSYRADITYGTNNAFGFDYLRDNMARGKGDQVQRKLHFAMIDEVDSVLVDDARTPLIISGQVDKGDQQQFYSLKPRIQKLFTEQKNLVNTLLVDAKKKLAEGNDGYKEGEGGMSLFRAYRGLPKSKPIIKYLSEQGIKVKLQAVENYYLQDKAKNMHIADDLLFFTIDEKNNDIQLTDKGVDLITGEGEDDNFFIMPDVGSEVADIEKLEIPEEEKQKIKDKVIQDFAIKSERLHSINQLLKAYTLFENDVEYIVQDGKVKIVDEQTGRIMEGRRYSDGLHQAIEAKENVKVEKASQTLATITLQNLFRMYHKLSGMTGTAETEAGEFWEIYKLDVVVIPTNRPIARDDQEDLIYRTVKEKYYAVIDEVIKLTKQGRPVLVGTTSVEVSELLSRTLTMRKIKHNVLNAKQHQREADIVAEAGIAGNVTIATNMAGRGTDIKLSQEVKDAGGLAIIGTERHESRRVDRQLRGRAGRQGDPGSSVFYVSLEDNLMRLFASERIAKMMDKMGFKEGEVIQHSMVSKSIERAQKKVEENNFGIRKHLIDYDDVMNTQRDVIYKRRQHALDGERLAVDLNNQFYDLIEEILVEHKETEDYSNFKFEVLRDFAMDASITEEAFLASTASELQEILFDEVKEFYERKCEALVRMTYPVLENWYHTNKESIHNINVPFTDGQRQAMVVTNLEQAYNSKGKSLVKDFEKQIVLNFIDVSWKEHLREMDDLKQGVRNAQWEQKDPLLIYKFEAFELFKTMVSKINRDITSFLFKASIPIQKNDEAKEATEQKQKASYKESRNEAEGNNGQQAPKKAQPVRVERKVGRNEPCPCGSGKKYKKCHGQAAAV